MSGKKKTILSIVIAILLIAAIIGVGLALRKKTTLSTPVTNSTIGMGTVVVESFYCSDTDVSKAAITKSTKIINELDKNRLSWREDGSDVAKLNAKGSGSVDPITYDCIKNCLDVSSKCDGIFDITVGKLSGLWNIGTEDARVPSDEEIDAALPTINYSRVALSNNQKVEIGTDQKLDLGAVGKGLACDVIKEYLVDTKVVGGTVSVGGSILVYGYNPTSKDKSWNVGVRDPFGNDSDYMAVINCGPCFISTSGDYEKVLVENGKKYHHILNPKTGYPAESNVTGITVICDSGALSDALSTACFILGYGEDSLKLLDEYNANAIFVTKDKKVYITDGIANSVTITNDSFKVEK